ncbi:hypothetical protein A3860_36585 [Niastella vici]|uniref:Glycosyltransferase RgtA/B/C/D-like domain-containing protein n=1 Tax=Niastella vici TaxID=1703345 RepID=A0A1V9FMV9_9BACT|nr:hypothetical protein [Niastella vici]OQP59689.1 hypothetical protein A3860_36585 [Niastella vici]
MKDSPNNEQTFINFLFYNRRNRIVLCLAAIAVVIQFIVFKYQFPFANFLYDDSFQYLEDATSNPVISIHPVGYARFLRLISIFTYSDTILAATQYLLLQASGLFLLFTLFYFHKLGKWLQYSLIIFIVINPLFLQLANLVSRDAFFASLSMSWLALMLWIIHKPSTKNIIWHTLVVFIAFTVRYQAIIYLFIAVMAFILSNIPLRKKLAGASAGILLCALLFCYQGFQFKKIAGHWQPAPLFGWLLANNAIYMYKHIPYNERKLVDIQYKALDKTVRRYLNSTMNVKFYPWEINEADDVYLWQLNSPLLKYADTSFKRVNDSLASQQKKWATMANYYEAYGIYLIRKYPVQYLSYYAGQGAKKYFFPPVEYLEIYNNGVMNIPDRAKNWFRYKSNKIMFRGGNNIAPFISLYSYLNSIMNTIFLFGLLYYFILKGWQQYKTFHKTLLFTGSLWITHALFTILLTTSALRLNIFPLILSTIMTLTLVDWMLEFIKQANPEGKGKAGYKPNHIQVIA